MEEYYTNLFFSVVLHVLLLFIFLTIFFWTVISKAESKSLYNELNNTIDKGFKNINVMSTLEEKGIPKSKISDIKKYFNNYFSNENIAYENNNKQILTLNIVIIVLITFSLLSMIFVRYLLCGKSINILEIIGENILVLLLVGAIEYFFFIKIASKFIPVKPSYLTEVVKKHIEKL